MSRYRGPASMREISKETTYPWSVDTLPLVVWLFGYMTICTLILSKLYRRKLIQVGYRLSIQSILPLCLSIYP